MIWKKIVRRLLLSFVILLVVLLLAIAGMIYFVFTPSKLTPVVEKTADEYLNADVRFESIELTFFSTFPDFGIKLKDVKVISHVFNNSLASKTDSLMKVGECLVTVKPIAYLTKGRIIIKDFVLNRPDIYAYIDSTGVANWNIVKSEPDTLSSDTTNADTVNFQTAVRLNNVKIQNGRFIFDDRSTRLYSEIAGANLSVDGFLGRRYSRLNMLFSAQNLIFWQEGKLLVNGVALGLDAQMKVNRDSMLYTLDKAVWDVNGIRFGAGGTLRADTLHRVVDVNLKYGIHIPSLKTLLDLIPPSVIKQTKEVEVKGDVSCQGEIRGAYGKQQIPLITAFFEIKNGAVAYTGMPGKIDTLNVALEALIDLEKQRSSYLKVNRFFVKGDGADLDIAAEVNRLLTSPRIKAKMNAHVDFAELTRIFPLADGVTCRGILNTSLLTDVLVKDVTEANYGRIKIGGWCKMNGINIHIPKDSMVINVRSAGLVFASNRKNRKTIQGVDLLNGMIGYSGLDVYFHKRLHLRMDTTYLTLKTSPLRDTNVIASVQSSLHLGKMVFVVRDTLLMGLRKANVKVSLSPDKRDPKIPHIRAMMEADSLRMRVTENRLRMQKASIALEAVRSKKNDKIWFPEGYIDFTGLGAYTPYFPLRITMPGSRLRFSSNDIQLDSAVLKLGRSDVRLTGRITNLVKAFFKNEDLIAELIVHSQLIDCNQWMRALEVGSEYQFRKKAGFRDSIASEADDLDALEVVSDTAAFAYNHAVFVVPPGIDFTFQTDIQKVIFGKLRLDSIHGEVVMRNQCIQLSDLQLRSSAANMSTSALYRATDTLRAYAGFDLQMDEIRIDSLVHLMPSLDTLFPMLRSFEGLVNFRIAADAWLDSAFMIELPTLRAAAYLDGHNLVLMDGETFAEISKMLMFKNKKRNLIDSVSLELLVKDGTVEIYPFLVEMDRYKAAVGGTHHLDMTFKYHISILKSPLPFRAGIDITGNLDKMKYRITRAKYKDLFIPSRRAKVDSSRLDLKQKMREVLDRYKNP